MSNAAQPVVGIAQFGFTKVRRPYSNGGTSVAVKYPPLVLLIRRQRQAPI